MRQRLVNWWRGFSDEDMEKVKDLIAQPNRSGVIYISQREKKALIHLQRPRTVANHRDETGWRNYYGFLKRWFLTIGNR